MFLLLVSVILLSYFFCEKINTNKIRVKRRKENYHAFLNFGWQQSCNYNDKRLSQIK